MNSTSPFLLQVHNVDWCVPAHPLWPFARLYALMIIITFGLQYLKVGITKTNEEYRQISYKQYFPGEPQVVQCRMFITQSEAWTLPQSKLIVFVTMLLSCFVSRVCFIQPHIMAFVWVSTNAVLVVAITYWADHEHQVASLFLAAIQCTIQLLLTVKVIRYLYDDYVWITLLTLQMVFVGIFMLFVLWSLEMKSVKQKSRVTCPYHVYSVFLPMVEYLNIGLFFIVMDLVYDPHYYTSIVVI
jgi:hypothetical protein